MDNPELPATDAAIRACLTPDAKREVDAAITTLVDRGMLFRRGQSGGYRLRPSTSVNLYPALEDAQRALGDIESVSRHVASFLEPSPVLARRHYLDRGTMRFFEVRYASLDRLEEIAALPTQADGIVLVALVDTPAARLDAFQIAKQGVLSKREDVVVGVTRPLNALIGDVKELLNWRWVGAHTAELVHDPYAGAEVKRQLTILSRRLEDQVGVAAALRIRGAAAVEWRRLGLAFKTPNGLSSALSDICDALFEDTPRIKNELLNRKALSSAAAAARMRLIEGLFAASDRPLFGINERKAPPEKSMFLSVIKRGGLQIPQDDRGALALPALERDPLCLRPALDEIEQMLAVGENARVNVQAIYTRLAERSFGIRMGVSPSLLAFPGSPALPASGHSVAKIS